MNNERRKAIQAVIDSVNSAIGEFEAVKDSISAIIEEEQEYFDNMPESLQGGEKGEAAEAAICALEEALSEIEGINFEEITPNLEAACD